MTLTAGNGVVTEKTIVGCPQWVFFKCVTPLTRLVVNVEGRGVICDLDEDGIIALSQAKQFGVKGDYRDGLAEEIVYGIQLATGFIGGVNVTFSVTNSNIGQSPTLYATSEAWAPANAKAFVQSISQKALANSGMYISGFGMLSMPTAAADDQVIINRKGNFQETASPAELVLRKPRYSSQNPNGIDFDQQIYNWDGSVLSVNFTPSADTIVYVQRYVAPYEINTKV